MNWESIEFCFACGMIALGTWLGGWAMLPWTLVLVGIANLLLVGIGTKLCWLAATPKEETDKK